MEMVMSNHFLCKELVHHPIETTIYKWIFGVPGENHLWVKDFMFKNKSPTRQSQVIFGQSLTCFRSMTAILCLAFQSSDVEV